VTGDGGAVSGAGGNPLRRVQSRLGSSLGWDVSAYLLPLARGFNMMLITLLKFCRMGEAMLEITIYQMS
jgi:hypothetical protein